MIAVHGGVAASVRRGRGQVTPQRYSQRWSERTTMFNLPNGEVEGVTRHATGGRHRGAGTGAICYGRCEVGEVNTYRYYVGQRHTDASDRYVGYVILSERVARATSSGMFTMAYHIRFMSRIATLSRIKSTTNAVRLCYQRHAVTLRSQRLR